MKPDSSTTGPALCQGAESLVRAHLLGSIATKQKMLDGNVGEILAAAGIVVAALRAGRKLLLCGNGGSAADCQHMAAELVGSLRRECVRGALAAIALTTDSSILTASANDFGYERVFERQVEALGQPGDVLVAISTSGNSENVLRAVRAAQKRGLTAIALTGGAGGALLTAADLAIRISSPNTQHVQEAHIAVAHMLCELVERSLFPEQFERG
ncbi:MAG: D-sedoheptulose 7-phosphate isomerase [Bryobacteraceae bacterium]